MEKHITYSHLHSHSVCNVASFSSFSVFVSTFATLMSCEGEKQQKAKSSKQLLLFVASLLSSSVSLARSN